MTDSAGREMDEAVAIEVMGWRWYSGSGTNREGEKVFHFGPPDYLVPEHWKSVKHTDPASYKGKKHECDMGRPFYSTDIAAAFEVVEKVRGPLLFTLTASTSEPGWRAYFSGGAGWVQGDTAPLAICKAALACVRGRGGESK